MDSRGETSVGQLNNRPPLSPQPSILSMYVYCNTAESDTSLRRPAVSFRSYMHLFLSLSFSPLFFPRLTNRQHNARAARPVTCAKNCHIHRV